MFRFLIKTLFVDIGGVLMTNGWGHELRERIAVEFGFDYQEFSKRHAMIFDLFERGKMSFDDYLKWTIFYTQRPFTIEEIKQTAYEAVRPFPEMIGLIRELKKEHQLKIVLLSNEGRELALDRIHRFALKEWADLFMISGFVGCRKPDHEIYRLALDLSQAKPLEVCYLDDRAHLIEVGRALGLHAIHHTSAEQTKKEFEKFFVAA